MFKFDFGTANQAQRQAISTVDGPLLITAGPGTGKTYTLVQRVIYLIQECGISPEQILIATFTSKAAKELITRIAQELSTKDISFNAHEMYIGTFHSLCRRMINDHLEYTRLTKNYRVLDDFDQKYLALQNMIQFKKIPDLETILTEKKSLWRQSKEICALVNALNEELIEPTTLMNDPDPQIISLGKLLASYQNLLTDSNLIDYSLMQTVAYGLLSGNPEILRRLHAKIRYIMVDEYQDSNYIQEQLIFLLGGERRNICVVGDEDQGLYRFRGTTVRNIVEFPKKFEDGECRTIHLTVNYRSNSGIVDFYSRWMSDTRGKKFSFTWDGFRVPKTIEPCAQSPSTSPAVIKVSARNDEERWHQKILVFLQDLKTSGRIGNYNQAAFLFNSVKDPKAVGLAAYLEEHGINVYSPRSNMFFEREEIKLALGSLMLMFPDSIAVSSAEEYPSAGNKKYEKYRADCVTTAERILHHPQHRELLTFTLERCVEHTDLTNNTDYTYLGLLYQLFKFEPFRSILGHDTNDASILDSRPLRNIARLTQVIKKFEYLHHIDLLSPRSLAKNTELFFTRYLRLLYSDGTPEHEDDTGDAPSGCVSFLTIRQSKGMEFPLVFVGSLDKSPQQCSNPLMEKVEDQYFSHTPFEPRSQTKYFDFWRQYYTAFSRAQNLLVLTCNEQDQHRRIPSAPFANIYRKIKSGANSSFSLAEFDFANLKKLSLKETFSFTSHITVYETCSQQYKFYKELNFAPFSVNTMIFGLLVHQTIEDIHRAVLRDEQHLIAKENITLWVEKNYASITELERQYLAEAQKKAALTQVLHYAEKQANQWHHIQEVEVDVSLVNPGYIIRGKIDLISGTDGTLEIIDFKPEEKPDTTTHNKRLEHQLRQLHVYAHLIENRTGKKVSAMHLYYTGETNTDPMISYPYSKASVDETVAAFDTIVGKIMRKEYTHRAKSPATCNSCDFRHYCHS